MSASDLDRLVRAAREDGGVDWTKERADRVLRGAVRRHEHRGRVTRRALAVGSVALVVVLFVLRGAASGSGAAPEASPELTASSLSASGDAGYARD